MVAMRIRLWLATAAATPEIQAQQDPNGRFGVAFRVENHRKSRIARFKIPFCTVCGGYKRDAFALVQNQKYTKLNLCNETAPPCILLPLA